MLTPINTVLVANRGEIACRIMRTLRDLGLRSVAVYTDADAGAPHVALADQAVRIGAGPVGDSYLDAGKILDAARATGADAIHPGYGFLSENADFARAIADAGLTFVGPPAAAIAAMGDKAEAKRAMIKAGVPCVPGYEGDDQSDATLIEQGTEIGVPLMVKASAGGGGRGMRVVTDLADLPDAITRARSEAASAFGSDHLILERAVMRARHVEVQVFADAHGTCIHLGERDCSIQRRHQKVVEEAPCPVMTSDLRAAMGAAAVAAAQSVDYRGAGTVEFLLDADDNFYFLEMNTRLQVEHPVTEMITGLDLVALQIAVAQGAPLGLTQDDVTLTGHAIELRIYAEDPASDFLPQTGDITLWVPPTGAGIRVDAGIVTGQEVSPFYDPMLAKLVAWGETRDIARARLIAALRDMALLGVTNNIGFLLDVVGQDAFANGEATTAFIGETYPDGIDAPHLTPAVTALASAVVLDADHAAAQAASSLGSDALRGLGGVATPIELTYDGDPIRAQGQPIAGGWRIELADGQHDVVLGQGRAVIDGTGHHVHAYASRHGVDLAVNGQHHSLTRHRPWDQADGAAGSGRIAAPMPGVVVSIDVEMDQQVEPGQTIAVLEAMKMQHKLVADIAGTVAQINAKAGDQVVSGAVLITIEAADE